MSAEIVLSALRLNHMPTEGLPEIALIGRSNVGKSSLVNAMLGRRSLARISSSPGKTRLMNFYLINQEFYLVDVPGYGYAKFAQTERLELRKYLEVYLAKRNQLQLVVQLVDFRHPPSREDIIMHVLVRNSGVALKVVATKADKVARSQHQAHEKMLLEALRLHPGELIVTSASGKSGIDELWTHIADAFPDVLGGCSTIEQVEDTKGRN